MRDTTRATRIRRRAVRAAATVVATGLVAMGAAACQPAPVPPRPPTPRPPTTLPLPPNTTAPAAPVPAVLEVTYRSSGSGGGSLVYTVRCSPGGTASVTPPVAGVDARRACANAAAERTLLVEGPPPGRVCIQQYFGPDTARVTGWVDDAPVDLTFRRNDGCVEYDWYRVRHIVPLPPARGGL